MYVCSMLGAFGTLPEEYILHNPCGLFKPSINYLKL